jgi:hypothetical protein
MSCEQNVKCEEECFDMFIELVQESYDIQAMLSYCFLEPYEHWHLCEEAGYIWDYTDDDHVFNILWNWDMEGMYNDMEGTIKRYYEEKFI